MRSNRLKPAAAAAHAAVIDAMLLEAVASPGGSSAHRLVVDYLHDHDLLGKARYANLAAAISKGIEFDEFRRRMHRQGDYYCGYLVEWQADLCGWNLPGTRSRVLGQSVAAHMMRRRGKEGCGLFMILPWRIRQKALEDHPTLWVPLKSRAEELARKVPTGVYCGYSLTIAAHETEDGRIRLSDVWHKMLGE